MKVLRHEDTTTFFLFLMDDDGVGRILFFAEAGVDELFECVEGGGGVVAFGDDFEGGAGGGSEHHHLHDGFSVDDLVAFPDFDGGLELVGDIDKLHGGARVEAKLILDGDLSIHDGHR